MPRISEFFGIVIYMYWFDTDKHKSPHFHAKYSDLNAVFSLDGTPLAGTLGKTGDRLVKEWADSRTRELQGAWKLAVVGKEVPWIKPIQ